jgi:hypothetical protein
VQALRSARADRRVGSVRIVRPTCAAAVLAITRMNRLNFSTTKPNAITAIPVRTQARKVRSLAAWSVKLRIIMGSRVARQQRPPTRQSSSAVRLFVLNHYRRCRIRIESPTQNAVIAGTTPMRGWATTPFRPVSASGPLFVIGLAICRRGPSWRAARLAITAVLRRQRLPRSATTIKTGTRDG